MFWGGCPGSVVLSTTSMVLHQGLKIFCSHFFKYFYFFCDPHLMWRVWLACYHGCCPMFIFIDSNLYVLHPLNVGKVCCQIPPWGFLTCFYLLRCQLTKRYILHTSVHLPMMTLCSYLGEWKLDDMMTLLYCGAFLGLITCLCVGLSLFSRTRLSVVVLAVKHTGTFH